MMLELSPDRSFGVLSPAFLGNEGDYAWREFSGNGCTFLERGLCSLFGTPFQPLECRFCHHDRVGKGDVCHRELERDWDTAKGRRLVRQWLIARGLGVPPFFS